MKRAALVLSVATCAFLASRESVAAERQHHLGLDPSLAILAIDDKSTASVGVGMGLHYTYGLNDQFNFMAELNGSIVAKSQDQDTPTTPRTRPAEVDYASVGVGYVIDVIQWVPYLCVLAGGYRLSGGTLADSLVLPGLEVGLGLDYQVTRHWTVGLGGRQHMLLTKMSTYPSYTTAFLRLEYAWGF